VESAHEEARAAAARVGDLKDMGLSLTETYNRPLLRFMQSTGRNAPLMVSASRPIESASAALARKTGTAT
jgi:hypothetical protein